MSNFLPLYVRHILTETDWSTHEITVYSALLEKGAMDLSRVSLETNIGTSSVQYALKKLHERQMVTKFLWNGKPKWKAKDIDALRRWFKGQTQQLQVNEEAVGRFIDQYDFRPDGSIPCVEIHEGLKAVRKALEDLAGRASATTVLVIAQGAPLLEEAYAALRGKGIGVTVLPMGEGEERAALHVVGDAVFAVHAEGAGPVALSFEYPQMAGLLRGMFQCLWSASGNG